MGRESAGTRNNRLHQYNIRRSAWQNTDAVQLMVTPRHPNLHVFAAAWGRESAGMRNNWLHQNNIRRTVQQNTDTVQLVVTPRHPNLHVYLCSCLEEGVSRHA